MRPYKARPFLFCEPPLRWFLVLLAGVMTALYPLQGVSGETAPPPPGKAAQGLRVDEKSYVIGPTDVLEIQVWREPNLSRTVPVRPDGKITLPLLNDVQAAGLTPLELKSRLEKALARFIANPTVSVSVQEIHSKNIYVMGKVNTPGTFPLRQGLTVLQALSLAGGLAEWADEDNIIIIRTENGKQRKIRFDYSRVASGKDLDKNIQLKPGDTIIVP